MRQSSHLDPHPCCCFCSLSSSAASCSSGSTKQNIHCNVVSGHSFHAGEEKMRALKLLSVSMILASFVAAANAQSTIKTVFIILMENHNWTGGKKSANIKG